MCALWQAQVDGIAGERAGAEALAKLGKAPAERTEGVVGLLEQFGGEPAAGDRALLGEKPGENGPDLMAAHRAVLAVGVRYAGRAE